MPYSILQRLTASAALTALTAVGCGVDRSTDRAARATSSAGTPTSVARASPADPQPPSRPAPPPSQSRTVDLKVIKYSDLTAAVKAHKGRVLVVDVWAEY